MQRRAVAFVNLGDKTIVIAVISHHVGNSDICNILGISFITAECFPSSCDIALLSERLLLSLINPV